MQVDKISLDRGTRECFSLFNLIGSQDYTDGAVIARRGADGRLKITRLGKVIWIIWPTSNNGSIDLLLVSAYSGQFCVLGRRCMTFYTG